MLKAPTQRTGTAAEPAVRKTFWSKSLPILTWQLAALLFVEAVLFCAGIGEEEIFKFDRKLGFRHFPNKIVTWRSEGFARSYFDADGMRESGLTISKPANTLRVALLGDSEVESLQVPIEKTYGQLIEKNLAPVNGRKVQVLNFGNSGYSTTQECLLLEDKVFKYQPDLVVLGYSNRDMMENWSPPDETISNVRPAALKLPGRELIIDSTPVSNWLKTPRGRFLQSIEWIRQNSRVWGIISTTELQLSMKDPVVRALLSLCTDPVRTSRAWFRAAKNFVVASGGQAKIMQAPARAVTRPPGATAVAASTAPAVVSQSIQPPPVTAVASSPARARLEIAAGAVAAPAPVTAAVIKTAALTNGAIDSASDPAEKNQYIRLLVATMGGLLSKMNRDCLSHHARFVVAGMPCRSDLAPFAADAGTPDLTCTEELFILRKLCANASVPFYDINSPARALSLQERQALFLNVHLAPAGHRYMSQQLGPALGVALNDL